MGFALEHSGEVFYLTPSRNRHVGNRASGECIRDVPEADFCQRRGESVLCDFEMKD